MMSEQHFPVDAEPAPPSHPVEHLQIRANGQRFYVAAAGPVDGPAVMLLHGFPEMSYGWRHQLDTNYTINRGPGRQCRGPG